MRFKSHKMLTYRLSLLIRTDRDCPSEGDTARLGWESFWQKVDVAFLSNMRCSLYSYSYKLHYRYNCHSLPLNLTLLTSSDPEILVEMRREDISARYNAIETKASMLGTRKNMIYDLKDVLCWSFVAWKVNAHRVLLEARKPREQKLGLCEHVSKAFPRVRI